MPVKVIDASALAAIVFAEPEADRVVAQLRGCTLAAPALLPFEIASVCLKKLRRYPKKRSLLLAAFRMMDLMEISQTEVDFQNAILLAEQKQLTVYDAAYLWLARRLGAELVTLDEKVTKAWNQR